MEFTKDSSAGFLANHMARVFATALAHRLRPLGVAPAQFMTLIELWEHDGLTQRQLVERLDVEQATMANTLNRMERDALIERRAGPGDKRTRLIFLTDKARALRGPAIGAAKAVNADAMANLSASEAAQLLALMPRVIAGLKATGKPPDVR